MTHHEHSESLFDFYFEYVRDTEPPIIYHRWSLITSVAAFLGRAYYLPTGIGRIFPNCYVMLIGNPGTRKSTAIKQAKRVLAQAGYNTFAAERTTKEKFLLDLEGAEDDGSGSSNKSHARDTNSRDVLRNLSLDDGSEAHDGIPREVFITADEFNEFAGTGNLDFLSTLGALWDWDDEINTYRQRFKNSKSISIFQPTISILGGNTHSSFQQAFPAAAIGQGFLSRLILVHSEPSGRKITFPQQPDERLVVRMLEKFNAIKQHVRGPAQLSPEASRMLDTIYRTWPELEDYRLKSYSTRRFTHLLKLCLICSAIRGTTTIGETDVILANTILTYTESHMSKALGEYGKNRHAEAAHALMTALYESKNPLTFDQLFKVVQRDLDKRDQFPDLLNSLQAAGKIRFLKETASFVPVNKALDSKARYVNLNLLKEMKS